MIERYKELKGKGRVTLVQDRTKPAKNQQVILTMGSYDSVTGESLGEKELELGIATINRQLAALEQRSVELTDELAKVTEQLDSLETLKADIIGAWK